MSEDTDTACHQCWGKGWVIVAKRKRRCIACVMRREHRGDRPYDEQNPSTLRHPNGSFVASFDRPFLAAATRCLLGLYAEAAA